MVLVWKHPRLFLSYQEGGSESPNPPASSCKLPAMFLKECRTSRSQWLEGGRETAKQRD